MRSLRELVILFAFMILPVWGNQQPTCVAPALSDQQVKDIIDKERATRTDLPAPFSEFRWIVRRQGCHYVYIEYGLPEAPDYRQSFKLNQQGTLVDAEPSKLKCTDKVLTESELAEIIKNERAKRKDLPPAFSNYKTRVDRLRCMYLYFEYALPERRGDYQVFTIDPFGELMDFSRSKPY
jgi:hypothetical protein